MTNHSEFRLTDLTAKPAHQLAAAYGHHWSCLDLSEVIGKTPTEIHELSVSREAPGPGCQHTAPQFHEYGNLTHVTQSGRLRWDIREDGTVDFEVFRPGPSHDGAGVSVLRAIVPVEDLTTLELSFSADDLRPGSVEDWVYFTGEQEPGRWALPRHIAAMNEAVSALKGNVNRETVLAFLEGLGERAQQHAALELQHQLSLVRTETVDDVRAALGDMLQRLRRMGRATDERGQPSTQAQQAQALANAVAQALDTAE